MTRNELAIVVVGNQSSREFKLFLSSTECPQKSNKIKFLRLIFCIKLAPSLPASADYTCLDLDYSGYHKNLIQLLFIM